MHDDNKSATETVAASAPTDDEDAREFEALIRDIAQLRDDDTIVEHMDPTAYRKGKRT